MKNIKVMSVFGTRPEAIKMAPLVKKLETTPGIESILVVTAQHREMLDQVLAIFDLTPDYDLNIMRPNQTLAGITTRALTGLEEVIAKTKPDIVLVHGDTTTTFSAALAAYYNQTAVGHVEAGLRTYDKYQPFPEEMNRKLTGALTDLHFAPTPLAKEHLLQENVDGENIFITGNTVIDALQTTITENYTFTVDKLNTIDYKNKRIISVTAHRRENLGEPLLAICRAILRIVNDHEDVEVVYAVHKNPAVSVPVHALLDGHPQIHLLEPLDLKDMHNLMYRSFLVMTDSGGLQEEVPSMGKPVLVLRNVTERPEGIEAGTLKLAGTDETTIYTMAAELLNDQTAYEKMAQAKNPFGDGHASERIISALQYYFKQAGNRPKDYICVNSDKGHKNTKRTGGMKMKDERMMILGMVEKGIITAEEAERLLFALSSASGDKDNVNNAVGSALNRAGNALNNLAKTLGQKAEELQPKVKDAAEKVQEKASDLMEDAKETYNEKMEPKLKRAADKMTDKAAEFFDDAKTYAEKLKQKREAGKESDEFYTDETILDEEELNEVMEYLNEEEPEDLEEEVDEDAAMLEKKLKELDAISQQMDILNDAEATLKNMFGDMPYEDEEDEEEDTQNQEKKTD